MVLVFVFLGWNVGTLDNTRTLSECVTQDPRVGPLEACAIHPTHPVHLVACTSEALKSLWTNPKSITSKRMGCINVRKLKIFCSCCCNAVLSRLMVLGLCVKFVLCKGFAQK